MAVGLGVATGVEGAATLSARDDIKAAVAANDTAKATSLYDAARSTQLRTNVLIGATAAAGIATVVLAFSTDWSGKSNTRGAHADDRRCRRRVRRPFLITRDRIL